MGKFFLSIRRFLRDEGGVTAVEYGLIAALIALAVIVTVYLVGQQLNTVYQQILNCLKNEAPCVAAG